jgi:hypothetical protein
MFVRLAWLAILTLLLAPVPLVGCGRSPLFSSRFDSGVDRQQVSVPDARADAKADTASDTRADTTTDGPGTDGGVDRPSDARPDAAADTTTSDRPSDVRADITVPVDTAVDVPVDRAADARDGGFEVAPDAGRDATQVEVSPADARRDVVPDGIPDAAGDRVLPDATGDLARDVPAPVDGGDGGTKTCDLVLQNECPMGERCDIAVSASGTLGVSCVPDRGGKGTHRAMCGNGPRDCRPGATCLQDVDRDGNPIGTPRCNDFCHVDGDCPPGSACIQTTLFDQGQRLLVGICWP